ncbi:MAG: nuclease A inhibitor family protein [Sandaracinaceae bacterium]
MRNAVGGLVALVLLGACAADVDDDAAMVEALRFTPEEVGVTRLLNAPTTTFELLDQSVPLDSRAARNLIAHRDGADGLFGTRDDDPFDDLAEVDAVSYVGTLAIDRLIAYAASHGLVPGPDDVLGTFDSVAFTVAEAQRALDVVNTASSATLRESVPLDSRAVTSIMAARPIDTMGELAALYYVGTAAMTRIKAYSAPPVMGSCESLSSQIGTAAAGMWFTSESDYPLTAVTFATPQTTSTILPTLGLPPSTPVETQTVDRFFTQLGYSNDEAAVAALRTLLESDLRDIRVIRVGRIQIQVYVIGTTTCGGAAGFSTVSIET